MLAAPVPQSSENGEPLGTGGGTLKPVGPMIVIATLLLLFSAVPPIFLPFPSELKRADVVFVLGPATADRIEYAEALILDGFASEMLISAGNGPGPYTMRQLPVCSEERSFAVHCEKSDPFTTQGEIALLSSYAQVEGWESAIVVTSPSHANRAHLYLERCFSGEATVVAGRSDLAPQDLIPEYVYQLGGYAKAIFVTTGCVSIE